VPLHLFVGADLQSRLGVLKVALLNVLTATEQRASLLRNAASASEIFFSDFLSISETLRGIKDSLEMTEPPGIDPDIVRNQLHRLQVRPTPNSSILVSAMLQQSAVALILCFWLKFVPFFKL